LAVSWLFLCLCVLLAVGFEEDTHGVGERFAGDLGEEVDCVALDVF
jgi:hypothetical protein